MDGARDFLLDVKTSGKAEGNLLGLLNVLIGRRIEKPDGTVVSSGLTWRSCAALLKKVRWSKDAAADLDLQLQTLPPRDRERYWYTAIAHARVDSPEATQAGDRLAEQLRRNGYRVSAAPAG